MGNTMPTRPTPSASSPAPSSSEKTERSALITGLYPFLPLWGMEPRKSARLGNGRFGLTG